MRIVFLGTPEYSAHHLEKMIESGFNVVCVVTQPDRPAGRGYKLMESPVKRIALKHNLKVLQPENPNANEFVEELKKYEPDLGIIVSYGWILKDGMLKVPKFGYFNVHPSLLPKYRGPEPIRRALENGERRTGITIFKIDEGIDSGKIAKMVEVEIGERENYGELSERLMKIGAELLVDFLREFEDRGGRIELKDQVGVGSYAPKLKKEELFIDWTANARRIFNKIRSLDPSPGARTKLKSKLVKLFSAISYEMDGEHDEEGVILDITNEGAKISCGRGKVIIGEIQLEGKRRTNFMSLKNGRVIEKGDRFS